MSALDNMRKRLRYNGGEQQQSRMIEDKLRSLKKALLYSYQAGTMIIDNPDYQKNSIDRLQSLETFEFRCLMNPDKLTFDADKKMLSVPFEDVCLNADRAGTMTEGIIPVPISCGDTFIWKETNTRWLVTLRYLEELAYFRADVRKCFPFPMKINENEYWFSLVGENEKILEWNRKNREEWNKLNYTRTIYIKRNNETFDFFRRFKIIDLPDIDGSLHPWEVQAVNPNAIDDVLVIHVKEYFENEFEDISAEEQAKKQEEYELNEDLVIYAYDNFSYGMPYVEGAAWEIRNQSTGLKFNVDAEIIGADTIVTVQMMNGKTGEFDLYYNNSLARHVVVKPV